MTVLRLFNALLFTLATIITKRKAGHPSAVRCPLREQLHQRRLFECQPLVKETVQNTSEKYGTYPISHCNHAADDKHTVSQIRGMTVPTVGAVSDHAVLRQPHLCNLVRETRSSGNDCHLSYAFTENHHPYTGRLDGAGHVPPAPPRFETSRPVSKQQRATQQRVPPSHLSGLLVVDECQ